MEPSHVLVPLDGSPLAEDALEYTVSVFDCPVTVLNVVTHLDSSMSESGVLDDEETRMGEARANAEAVVDDVLDSTDTDGADVDVVVESGDPAETILRYVDEHDVDHVVMGGHGGDRGQLAKRLLGTLSMAVVGDAPVPVTVVR